MKDPRKTNYLAIISFVFIIIAIAIPFLPFSTFGYRLQVSLCFFAIAFILGVFAFVFCRERLKGRVFAITSMVITILFIFFGINSSLRFMDAREMYKFRQIGKVLIEYSENNNGYLPEANRWCDLLKESNRSISKNSFRHTLGTYTKYHSAFNKNLSSLRLTNVPNDIVLLFTAEGDWNLNGAEKLLQETKGLDTYVLLVNGEVYSYNFEKNGIEIWDEKLKKEVIKSLRWKP